MAQLLVRNLEDYVKTRLRLRARRYGRTTEEDERGDRLRDPFRPGAPGAGTAADPVRGAFVPALGRARGGTRNSGKGRAARTCLWPHKALSPQNPK